MNCHKIRQVLWWIEQEDKRYYDSKSDRDLFTTRKHEQTNVIVDISFISMPIHI